MALAYNFQNILACITTLEPILADSIQQLALARLMQLGESADNDACRWTNTNPGNCNFAMIRNVINNITDVGELQQIEDCARIICELDDEESTSSASSSPSSSVMDTSESSAAYLDCDSYFVNTPQSYETGTSTLAIDMDVLEGNVQWDNARVNGTVQLTILEIKGYPSLPPIGLVEVDAELGRVIYVPNPDGSEAGAVINIHVLATETNSLCEVDMWIHLVVTEETTTT